MAGLSRERGANILTLVAFTFEAAIQLLSGNRKEALGLLERSESAAQHVEHEAKHIALETGRALVHISENRWGAAIASLEEAVRRLNAQRLCVLYYTLGPYLLLAGAYLFGARQVENKRQRRRMLRRAGKTLRTARLLCVRFPVYIALLHVLGGLHLAEKRRLRRADRKLGKGMAALRAAGATYYLPISSRLAQDRYACLGDTAAMENHARAAEAALARCEFPSRDGTGSNETLLQADAVHGAGEKAEPPAGNRNASSLAGREGPEGQSALLDAAHLLTSTLDPDRVLEEIMDLSTSCLKAERGFLMLYPEEPDPASADAGGPGTGPLRVRVARNIRKETMDEGSFVFSRKVLEEVATTRRGIVVTNAQQDPRLDGSESVVFHDLKSILCAPLLDRERLVGLLYLDNHLVSHLFTEGDLRFLEALASFAVVAINNAWAHREVCRQRDKVSHLQKRLQEEVVYLKDEIREEHNFEEIVGGCAAMRDVFRFIETTAPSGQSILIQGETGTGKELVARAIHKRSPRDGRPMIKVNCASIPDGLLESEMLGHEKGAFTGAVQGKPGRFELADGGTLFLDEIGEIPLPLQAKLLRALEEKEFERVGGTRTIKVDMCVIAATNRDLDDQVAKGLFRKDLYYRLSVLPVRLPPLRERREDIPLLLRFFIHKFNRKYGKRIEKLDRASLNMVNSYRWPGNVRELEHVVERGIVLSNAPLLNLAGMIPVENLRAPQRPGDPPSMITGTYAESVRSSKIRIVEEALARTGGIKKRAAALLGISPPHLSKLLRELGIHS